MAVVRLTSGKTFESEEGSTILDAATRVGITIPYSCKTGRGSTCKCKIVAGQTKTLTEELGLTEIEKSEGWILSCVRNPITDLVIDVEDFGGFHIPEATMHVCRIASLDKLAQDVIKVILRLPPNVAFNFIPGQYIEVVGPGGIRRSYSIANAPVETNTLELHVRAVENGKMSQYWFNQSAPNDLLRFHGPLGTFFMRNIAKRDLIFLATGTGIAPIKAMLEALSSAVKDELPQSITVVWGARYAQDLYFDVVPLCGVQSYIPVLSRAEESWQGDRGYVQDALLRHMPDLRNGIVYACGSEVMIRSARSTLVAAGLPGEKFYSDAFVCSDTAQLKIT